MEHSKSTVTSYDLREQSRSSVAEPGEPAKGQDPENPALNEEGQEETLTGEGGHVQAGDQGQVKRGYKAGKAS